ncbi:MAG: glycosyltransferase [Anaerolineae bacterium]|nr:glycosyltransferase [Anaerolineae bacterium]
MSHPDLSIVIAAWNRVELTRQCLESLRGCRLALEIILIDNGSIDGTTEMVEREFPDVRIIRNRRNRGVTIAWRQGLEAASAPLVCISNNDLVYEPGCLERLVEPLCETDWIGITSPETVMPEDEVIPFFMEAARIPPEPQSQGFRIGFTGWCFVFRKADYPENFDRRFKLWYQDKDFLYTLLFNRRGIPPFRWTVPGKVPVVVPGARIEHVYHASHDQLKPAWITRRTHKDRARFNKKWRGYRGNRYVNDIGWSDTVFDEKSSYQIVTRNDTSPPSDLPLVSIIIPCYNRSDLLADTLESVTRQTYPAYEIVLVDDGSQEDLRPVVERTLHDYPNRWTLARLARNSGPGIARRVGLELAQGDYLQYLDSDDLLHPHKLAEQVAVLDLYPELVMTYAQTNAIDAAGNVQETLGRTDQEFTRILPHIMQRMIWTTSSCLWRRSRTDAQSNWQPLYGPEDTLHDFLIGLCDQPIARTPSDIPLITRRLHLENISHNLAEDAAYQQEILKSYDLMWAALEQSERCTDFRRQMARLYANKIMTFLILRRYWEARHCIDRTREIDRWKLPLDARIAVAINRASGTQVGFALLRRWRWLVKIARRRIARSG